MNAQLQKFARDWLKAKLVLCTEAQLTVFRRMYAGTGKGGMVVEGDLERSISDVVDAMREDHLNWAMRQVENTLKKQGIEVTG